MTEVVVGNWFSKSFFGTSSLGTGFEELLKTSVVVETIELVGNFVVVSFSELGLEELPEVVETIGLAVGNSFLGT